MAIEMATAGAIWRGTRLMAISTLGNLDAVFGTLRRLEVEGQFYL
jgi:hypothetical protein